MGFKKFMLYVEIIYEVFTKEGAVCAAPEFCVFTFIENCSGTKENLNMMLSARIGAARRLLLITQLQQVLQDAFE